MRRNANGILLFHNMRFAPKRTNSLCSLAACRKECINFALLYFATMVEYQRIYVKFLKYSYALLSIEMEDYMRKKFMKILSVALMSGLLLTACGDDSSNNEKKVYAVEAGSAGEAAIADNELNANYTAVSTQADALMEVASGSADACVIDITMANAMTGEGTSYANLKGGLDLTSEEYVIGFRKGSDACAKVNEIMAEMMSDGTLDALAAKYSLTLVK